VNLVEFEKGIERLTTYDFDYLRKVWSESLTDEEDIHLKRIMSEHPEYYSFFENPDQIREEEVFLHLVNHLVIETQLIQRSPIEVLQFVNHVKNYRGSHHHAVHLASLPFFEQVVIAEKSGADIDLNAYRSNLRRLRKRPLNKIEKVLLKNV